MIYVNLFLSILFIIISAKKYTLDHPVVFFGILNFVYIVVPAFIFYYLYQDIPQGISVPKSIYLNHFKQSINLTFIYFISCFFGLLTIYKFKHSVVFFDNIKLSNKLLKIILIISIALYVIPQFLAIGGIKQWINAGWVEMERSRRAFRAWTQFPLMISFLLLNRSRLNFFSFVLIFLTAVFSFRLGNRRIIFMLILSLIPILYDKFEVMRRNQKIIIASIFCFMIIFGLAVPILRSGINSFSYKNIFLLYEGNGVYAGFLYNLQETQSTNINILNSLYYILIEPILNFVGWFLDVEKSSFALRTMELAKYYTGGTGLSAMPIIEWYSYLGSVGVIIAPIIYIFILSIFKYQPITKSFAYLILFNYFRGDLTTGFDFFVYFSAFFLVIFFGVHLITKVGMNYKADR